MIVFFRKLCRMKETDFFSVIKKNLLYNKKMFIVTANPEAFMYGDNDGAVEKLLLDELNNN